MHKKFEINRTKIKGGCQSGRKLVTHNSKSDLPLVKLLEKKYDFLYLLSYFSEADDKKKLPKAIFFGVGEALLPSTPKKNIACVPKQEPPYAIKIGVFR